MICLIWYHELIVIKVIGCIIFNALMKIAWSQGVVFLAPDSGGKHREPEEGF